MLKTTLKTLAVATALAGLALPAFAQDFMLRATANSNEQDEDYDGLVVFKDYGETASNGRIGVELFIGTQLCST
jgi:TRAP-type transport system periplasmic protein